jgi:hypothetical protein
VETRSYGKDYLWLKSPNFWVDPRLLISIEEHFCKFETTFRAHCNSVRHYPRFHVTEVGLGTYYPQLRGTNVYLEKKKVGKSFPSKL